MKRRERTHYSVTVNMPGYMPDEPATWTHNLKDAQAMALWEARELREAGYVVYGSKKAGRYWTKCGQYVVNIYGPFSAPCDRDCDD